ncbi:hypothetical protein CP8484711_0927B, partial [Chlamydia psittaci 84-8471/1]
LNVVE